LKSFFHKPVDGSLSSQQTVERNAEEVVEASGSKVCSCLGTEGMQLKHCCPK
jgi:hypothetical protein